MIGLPVGDAHVPGHFLATHCGSLGFLESEHAEEVDCFAQVGDGDGDVIETAVGGRTHRFSVREA